MNELQVNVNQTPGYIEWNFDELKAELAEQMEKYTKMVYTDETIKEAKADVASLRKLSKAVNSRKIEIKNKCLEPYAVIEAQAKELLALIDNPIRMIDSKVKEYQERQKQIRRDMILEYMKETFSALPDEVAAKLRFKIYDARWENTTCSQKTYKDAIDIAFERTKNELGLLKNVEPEFYDEVYQVYMKELEFTQAIERANYLQKKREEILERERRRQEQERIRREQEEARKEVETIEMPAVDVRTTPAIVKPAEQEVFVGPEVVVKNSNIIRYPSIVFKGTPEQFDKVVGYIKFIGADFEVIL